MKNLLLTGYRAHELGIYDQKHKGIPYIKKALYNKLLPLAEQGLEWVITPGQFGVDLWGCEVVLALKEQYPSLKLSILSAYLNPEEKWKEEKQTYYRDIVRQLDYYGFVSKQPYQGGWQLKARDELLVRKTEGLLLFYDEEAAESGARFYKERALGKQQSGESYELILITADTVQSIAEDESMSRLDEVYE
ncbi:SLOG family protein [Paenibacillus sp. GCM10023252]|uniref:SLOG family protein n=1 Tax=Paenibacillus sp. GCM10023252 TaxID=3252649 RepID=UPI00361B938B